MDAETEGDLPALPARDIEAFRVRERLRVAVGGVQHQEDALARPDASAANLHVLGRDPGDGRGGRVEAQHFLHRRLRARRLPAQQVLLARMVDQAHQAVGEQAGGGLVAGEEQQDAVRHQVVVGEAGARGKLGDEIAGRAAAAVVQQFAEGRVEAGDGGLRAEMLVGRGLRGADEEREVVAPALEVVEAVQRRAEDFHDDAGRQRIGEVGDEIHRPAIQRRPEQGVDPPRDPGRHRGERGGSEAAVQMGANAGVLRRVEEDGPASERAFALLQLPPARGIEPLEIGRHALGREPPVALRGEAVVMAGQ